MAGQQQPVSSTTAADDMAAATVRCKAERLSKDELTETDYDSSLTDGPGRHAVATSFTSRLSNA
eukprot:scaffold2130_cov49-Cyclotella_meneghiniana.AAC.1